MSHKGVFKQMERDWSIKFDHRPMKLPNLLVEHLDREAERIEQYGACNECDKKPCWKPRMCWDCDTENECNECGQKTGRNSHMCLDCGSKK